MLPTKAARQLIIKRHHKAGQADHRQMGTSGGDQDEFRPVVEAGFLGSRNRPE
jgi:hypothetical protein